MGKSTRGSFTMRTSVISFGILLLVPTILADSFAGEKVKVGKKTCTCDFTFVLNGDRVNVKSSLVSCDKKCSGAAKNVEIVNHAGYDSNTVDNDFALLRMANKLDWSANPHIRPACLPEYTAGGTPPTYDQWMSTVTGWGTTSSGGSTSNVLLEVDVQVISNSECNNAYGGITDNMLCAADASGNGGSDACQVMMTMMTRMMMLMMMTTTMMTLMMMMTTIMTL